VLTGDEQTAIEENLRVVLIEEGFGKFDAAFALLARQGA
jgi:hypothetical protein